MIPETAHVIKKCAELYIQKTIGKSEEDLDFININILDVTVGKKEDTEFT